jgi:hypothetical protein
MSLSVSKDDTYSCNWFKTAFNDIFFLQVVADNRGSDGKVSR